MKKLLTTLAIFLSFALPAQAEIYTFDPAHTYVLWHVNHLGFSNVSGKWMAQGTLDLDEANPQNSKVNVSIDMAQLTTGVPKLDEHLKGKDFFDVAKFPTATFASTKVIVTGKNTARVQGNLTVHGVTKPVTLTVKMNQIGTHPMTQKKAVGFSATTTLQRAAFGVDAYVPKVGDDVTIELEAEASKAD